MTKDDDIFALTEQRLGDGTSVLRRGMSLKESKKMAETMRERMEERFRAAPFPLYGLPSSWVGERFFGGGEWGTDPGRERIHALSLVHGVLVRGQGRQLIVETSSPQSVGGGWLANAAGMVWSGYSSNIEEAVAEVHQGDPIAPDESLPVPVHSRLRPEIDGVATLFDAFVHADEWVARAQIGDCWLTVEGRPFDPADVRLVRIRDIEPYVVGTRRFNERR